MTLKQWVVDAFADAPFEGNPAAVVPLKVWLDDGLMQRIAAENNLSETAFFVETAPGRYGLRWFTPASEVDLCGHATLASAHVVFNHVAPKLEAVTFDTRSGPLTVTRAGGEMMTMDFPAIHAAVPQGAAEIGAKVAAIMGCPVPSEVFTAPDLMIVLETAAAVRALSPNAGLGQLLNDVKMRGLIATAPSDDPRFDFVSRFFAPNHGIPEDPVTGSAHCKLMPYWAKRLGKTKLTARQVSPRGGTLVCELKGERVTLTGRCEAFLEGVLAIRLGASAMNGEPPTERKLALIRKFLELSGAQSRIDKGYFVTRNLLSPTWLEFGMGRSEEVLLEVYQQHRATWQEEYESHANWEFSEDELAEMVEFLGKPAGAHFLEGRWRMDAYIETNMEEILGQIFDEAARILRGSTSS